MYGGARRAEHTAHGVTERDPSLMRDIRVTRAADVDRGRESQLRHDMPRAAQRRVPGTTRTVQRGRDRVERAAHRVVQRRLRVVAREVEGELGNRGRAREPFERLGQRRPGTRHVECGQRLQLPRGPYGELRFALREQIDRRPVPRSRPARAPCQHRLESRLAGEEAVDP